MVSIIFAAGFASGVIYVAFLLLCHMALTTGWKSSFQYKGPSKNHLLRRSYTPEALLHQGFGERVGVQLPLSFSEDFYFEFAIQVGVFQRLLQLSY